MHAVTKMTLYTTNLYTSIGDVLRFQLIDLIQSFLRRQVELKIELAGVILMR